MYAFLAFSLSIIFAWKQIIASPILETKLLLVTAFLLWLAALMAVFASYFVTAEEIGPVTRVLIKSEMALVGPIFIILTFAFMLPNFRLSYFSILQLSIIVAANIVLSFFLFNGAELEWIEGSRFLRYTLPPLEISMFVICTLIFLYYFFHRLYEVKNLRLREDTAFVSVWEMYLLIIIGISSVIVLLITLQIQGLDYVIAPFLPGHSFFIPFSFIFMITAYLLNRNTSYPFAVPIKLYGIIITEKETGVSILAKDYQNEIPAMEILGNLFSALDMSLQDTIKSTKTIEDIIFGDKVVHIATGNNISSILIVSKNSLITKSIARYITRQFERQFTKKIDYNRPVELSQFNSFDNTLDEIRKYLVM